MAKAHCAETLPSEKSRLMTPATLIEQELTAVEAARQDGSFPLSIRQAAERCGSSAADQREGTKARSDFAVVLKPLVSHCSSKPEDIAQFVFNILMRCAKRACLSPFFYSSLVLVARRLKAMNGQTL